MENQVGFWMSPLQEHVWSLQGDNKMTPYRVLAVVRLEGRVDAAQLRAALERVTARHDILRTAFRRQTGITFPFQVVNQSGFEWEVFDESGKPAGTQDQRIQEFLSGLKSTPLNLDAGPLLHARLLVNDRNAFLLVALPSLCADPWTVKNLASEVARAYRMELPQADEDVIQYAQFAQWQKDVIEGNDEQTLAGKQY